MQQLKVSTDLNVTKTPTPADGKGARLSIASPKIECGRVVLVEGEWNEDFVEEVASFPAQTHDEYVDLLYYAIDYFLLTPRELPEGLNKGSFSGLL